MEDDKPQGQDNKLSYQLLLAKIEEQNKTIAAQQEQIDDLKEVVKANLTNSSSANEEEGKKSLNKQEFEKRLKEDLKLC